MIFIGVITSSALVLPATLAQVPIWFRQSIWSCQQQYGNRPARS
jgi:hypothetical protein